ncbi:tRNA pseudouridine(13) synthase, partial [hydrothermal vent metagenome]
PSGEGEHLWLKIVKDGSNTDWVAQQLAKFAGIKANLVSYAGMKDRHAVSTQWFSLHLAGLENPDFSALSDPEFKILEFARHDRKLKRGALSGNAFHIRITDLSGDMPALEDKLNMIEQKGVPNYFGEQRFGRQMGNLYKAEQLFNRELKKLKKLQRGLYLSAARSWIFNQLLSTRIEQQSWLSAMQGEVYMLNGKSACFVDDNRDENFQRMLAKEINLTGCMWGEGESMPAGEVLELEKAVAGEFALFSAGLESARMKQERRALRLIPENMRWEIMDNVLDLAFDLPAGAFATMVLRECVVTQLAG